MLINLLIGLVVLVVVFLIVASFRPDELRVERSITISAPAALAFNQINDLHKWQEISPYVKDDPAAKTSFAGPTAGVGASFAWAGNVKVGEGRMTITESRPNELVRFKFEFFKPWYCTNTTELTFRSSGADTEVTWAMFMKNNFIAKASGLVMNMDKLMGENFEAGLAKLKAIAEAGAKQ
jgi:Polyketide cyclase / dehydrase and lipid transport